MASSRTSSLRKEGGDRRTFDARFAATRWSIVLAAAGRGPASENAAASTSTSRRALEELMGVYWFPLYAFLRRRGNSPQQAEDLTQGFLAHLLENEGLATVDRSRGKFRSFLLACLKNFASDQRDKAHAVKRGGTRRRLSLDAAEAEAHYPKGLTDTMTPERLFERSWAIAVLNQVVLRLEHEYAERGKTAAFEAMRHCLDGQADVQSHADIAEQLGMTEGAVRVMAHRLRQRYREILRDEIRQTVDGEELVNEEIQHLLDCL